MRNIALTTVVLICLAIPYVVNAQGCMGGDSDEGVSVVGFIQPQFEYKTVIDSKTGDTTGAYSFTFNRARVGFVGSIPYDISYYLFLECSPFKDNTPYLLDAFVSYTRLDPYAKFSLGKFKAPFSLELNTSCAGLHTVGRSTVVTQLAGPLRDFGLMILGNYKEYVKYNFAVMNGTGLAEWDENNAKDIVGRIVLSPIDMINLGGSFRFGRVESDIGEENDERNRYGGELQVKFADFLLQGEYIYGEDVGKNQMIEPIYGGCGGIIGYDTLDPGKYKKSGFFVQGMYMTPWNIQPVAKYEFYDPDTDLDKDSAGFKNSKSWVSTITFGINYFINDWSRLQINYLYKAEEVEVPNDEILIQLQAKF